MLVLTRREHESICIGDDIVLKVVDISGGKVRLGIQAPQEIPVHRREVYLKRQQWLDQEESDAEAALSS